MLKNFGSRKKYWSFILILSLVLNIFVGVLGYADDNSDSQYLQNIGKDYKSLVEESIDEGTDWILESFNGDKDSHWQSVAIARSGKEVPKSYLENIGGENLPKDNSGQYGKYILGILSAGGNPESIAGHNLYEELVELDLKRDTNIYTIPFGLLALDATNYEIPKDKDYTRDDLVGNILSLKEEDGGLPVGEWSTDGTGFALTALGKYYRQGNNQEVIDVVDKTVEKLSLEQQDNGGYGGNSNTAAQVLIGLTSCGIDPTSQEFTKNETNLVDNILTFKKDDGSFRWQKDSDEYISSATEQALYALEQYLFYLDNKGSIYDFIKNPVKTQDDEENQNIEKDYKLLVEKAVGFGTDWILESFNGDKDSHWQSVAIARSGKEVPKSYLENIGGENLPKDNSGQYGKYILGILSAGGNPESIAGHNLYEELVELDLKRDTNIYTIPFGLLALDATNYEIPKDKDYTRDDLVGNILSLKEEDGGLPVGEWSTDGTGFALTALGKYYRQGNNQEVIDVVDKTVEKLSLEQQDNGGYGGNSNTAAQVLIGLTSCGIDPTSQEFTKNETNLVDNILTFKKDDGSFRWQKDSDEYISSATEQALYALEQYLFYLDNKGSIYDFIKNPVKTKDQDNKEDQIFIDIGEDEKEHSIPIKTEDKSKQYKINISREYQSEVALDLPTNKELPKIEASKGEIELLIPMGTQVIESDKENLSISLMSKSKNTEGEIKTKLRNLVDTKKTEFDKLEKVFSMGGSERVEFNKYLTIKLKNMKNKELAYLQGDSIEEIRKYSNNQAGKSSNRSEYLYEDGNDLIIKTKHFTDFIVYSTKEIELKPETPSLYIRLSIDKDTIGKRAPLKRTKVGFKKGESVWDVTKREMDDRNIKYKYSEDSKYKSIYIQSIAGDGELDHGSGSGWKYNVDGIYQSVGADRYKLKDGEVVEWRYTTNLGKDLGEDITEWDEVTEDDKAKDENKDEEEKEEEENQDQDKEIELSKVYKDTDIISPWAYEEIKRATEQNIITGYNGEFRPKDDITRAEYIKIIVAGLDIKIGGNEENIFKDVDQSKWFNPYVTAAYNASIITGSEGRFNPNESITREEMAAMIVRALNLKPTESKTHMKDSKEISTWAKQEVETAIEAGLVKGTGENFNPKDKTTREMATVVIIRALDYNKDNE